MTIKWIDDNWSEIGSMQVSFSVSVNTYLQPKLACILIQSTISTYCVKQSDYSYDGVFLSQQQSDISSIHIGIVCKYYPFWALYFHNPIFNIRWILLMNTSYLPLIWKQFSNTKVYLWSQITNVVLTPVDVLCFNGVRMRPTPILNTACHYILFDQSYCARSSWNGWKFFPTQITHYEVSGVTSAAGVITICITQEQYKFSLPTKPLFVESPHSQSVDILKCTLKGVECGAPPKTAPSTDVIQLEKHLVHTAGLLLFNITLTNVITSSVFVSTCWVKHLLSTAELRQAMDLPALPMPFSREFILVCPLPLQILQSVENKLFLLQSKQHKNKDKQHNLSVWRVWYVHYGIR